MMAGLFAVFALAMALILGGFRKLSLTVALIGVGLCLLMLFYHATEALKINW